MIGVILAAGIGSRLRPLTESTPKCLLPVGGVPLLRRTLVALQKSGVRDAVIVTGFLHEEIERYVRAGSFDIHISIVRNERYESTGNNRSLWLAEPYASGSDMVMLDADILFDRRILEAVLGARCPDALALRDSRNLGTEEIKVECDAEGYVSRIGKDVDPRRAVGESLGIERFSGPTTRVLFESLGRRKDRNEFYEASFQEVVDAGGKILPVSTGNLPCVEIDTPEDLAQVEMLARGMPF